MSNADTPLASQLHALVQRNDLSRPAADAVVAGVRASSINDAAALKQSVAALNAASTSGGKFAPVFATLLAKGDIEVLHVLASSLAGWLGWASDTGDPPVVDPAPTPPVTPPIPDPPVTPPIPDPPVTPPTPTPPVTPPTPTPPVTPPIDPPVTPYQPTDHTLGDYGLIAGTAVLMADGTTRAIESLKTGDSVATRNNITGEPASATVTHVAVTHQKPTFVVQFQDGSTLQAAGTHALVDTSDHPIQLQQLKPGLKIATPTKEATVSTVSSTTQSFYRLTLKGGNTFFVGNGNFAVRHGG